MSTGVVKWFNSEKGYGFITPDEPSKDLFVHMNSVTEGGPLVENAKVTYEAREGQKGPEAIDVKVVA